jgi:penicillin-binding protein 1A
MLEDGMITAEQATEARDLPLGLAVAHDPDSLAPYFVEEIRRYLEGKYGSDQVHEGGLKVYTALNRELQRAANRTLFDGLAAYERRHGWKGHLQNVLSGEITLANYQHPDWDSEPEIGGYVHALVVGISSTSVTLKFGRYTATLAPGDAAWIHRKLQDIFLPGDLVYVKVLSLNPGGKARVSLEQDSGVQGALVAIDNATGEIKAMVGGRDFNVSKFNRTTQALRQVGSSFKPYVYTAAIDRGASPDDIVVDAPVTFPMPSGPPYEPHNYDEKFEGMITLRRALAQSRNIPALRVADSVGIRTVIDYARRFGITSNIPPYLPVALGAVEVTPIEQTSAFTVFPNDGVHITPRYITKVTDYEGRTLEENFPDVKDVISAHTARIMTSMLREVVLHGTAIAASSLKYPLAGKTGTTNNFTDAWFVGFSPSLTCGVWMGYDEKKFLGARETGARAALPIWMGFMKAALAGKDAGEFQPPPAPTLNTPPQKVDTPDMAPPEEETH